jgi:hypothetical protein
MLDLEQEQTVDGYIITMVKLHCSWMCLLTVSVGHFPSREYNLFWLLAKTITVYKTKSKYYKITTNLHDFSFRRDVNATLEDGTNILSRKVGTELPFYAASNPKRAQITQWTWFRHSYEAPFPTTQPEDCVIFVDYKLPFRSLTRNYEHAVYRANLLQSKSTYN